MPQPREAATTLGDTQKARPQNKLNYRKKERIIRQKAETINVDNKYKKLNLKKKGAKL